MTEHAALPKLCASCETQMHKIADANPRDRHVVKRCVHYGDDQHIVAVGFVLGGKIVSWQIQGPMRAEDAEAAGAKILMLMAAAGGISHGVTEH
jgi:hypothetical protein